MTRPRQRFAVLAVLASMTSGPIASADGLPLYAVAELCLRCDAVVEAEIIGPRRLRVLDRDQPLFRWKTSRWLHLTPERELALSGKPLTNLDQVVESAYLEEGEQGERIDSKRVVVFLKWWVNRKTGCGSWRVADLYLGGTAGIFFLAGEADDSACYGYVQFSNPGGYQLVAGDRTDRDRVPPDAGTLRKAVAKGSRLALRFESARKEKRLEDRVDAFAEFLRPEIDHLYFYRALRALERCGPPAAERLLALADVYEQQGDDGNREFSGPRRPQLLAAVGTIGDPASVPRLLELARQARERANGDRKTPVGPYEPISPDEATALKAAVRIDDPRALAACREALVRTAGGDDYPGIEYFLPPLADHPMAENIPALETALAVLPAGEIEPYTGRNYNEEARQEIREVLEEHRRRLNPVEAPQPQEEQ